MINSISKEEKGKVFINSILSGKLKLTSNDLVFFKEIEELKGLNNCSFRKIKIIGESIEIGDISKFLDYITGGIIYNVKSRKKN